jgi:CO dehydrogenase nickel-insertion accessory protein CooC1
VLLESGSNDDIIVIDADPAMNLHELLGVNVEKSVAEIVEEFRRKVDDVEVAVGFSKDALIEYWVYRAMVEANGFDFLSMGRGEGGGMLLLHKRSINKNYWQISKELQRCINGYGSWIGAFK